MGGVLLDTATHERLRVVAAALNMTEGEAVAELLHRLGGPAAGDRPETVAIHMIYKGQRVQAEFEAETRSVRLVSGPLAGERFSSPSRAAGEVITSINPATKPQRNGWTTWIVTSTGRRLQSIRGLR